MIPDQIRVRGLEEPMKVEDIVNILFDPIQDEVHSEVWDFNFGEECYGCNYIDIEVKVRHYFKT